MPTLLSIERISEDGLYGSTSNIKLIIKNGELAKDLISKDPKYSHLFFKAGRFVVVTVEQNNSLIMCFLDFKKSLSEAIGFAKEYFTEKDRGELFMYIFQKVNESYEQDYNEVELQLDSSFGQTSISGN